MITETVTKKLAVLSDAAKYDVSCASSGSNRRNVKKGVGNGVACGICHSFTEDGRCVSLLKILMANHCIYDCAYCINRRTNDRPRAAFTVKELVELTINFYRRNYIEGLFLSSGVIKSPDYTMERMVQVAKELRIKENYCGYIHLKAIPGASSGLVQEAGLYADRLSVNIEIPTEQQLLRLAPDKNYKRILNPMVQIKDGIIANKEDRRKYKKAPMFAPAGQSTQLIVGASPETDQQILKLSSQLYQKQKLKRVYFSGYLPVNGYDERLPAINKPPLIRENRLYQSDWLMRFYGFHADEILDEKNPFLDLNIDPKLAYAIRNPQFYPVDINKADYEWILRVPGIGVQSARKIIYARRFRKLNAEHLKKIGVVYKRAKYFINCNELPSRIHGFTPDALKNRIVAENRTQRNIANLQLSLFSKVHPIMPPVH